MKLIDKDKVISEIERIKKEECPIDSYEGRCKLLWFEQFLSFLNTLEVKDVDLEKEIYDAEKRFGDIDEMGGYRILLFDDEFRDILRHFYELGLKAKGE